MGLLKVISGVCSRVRNSTHTFWFPTLCFSYQVILTKILLSLLLCNMENIQCRNSLLHRKEKTFASQKNGHWDVPAEKSTQSSHLPPSFQLL